MTFVRGYHPHLALAEILKVDDSKAQQSVKHRALTGELHTQILRPQFHGFSSNPPVGSSGVVISLGGERSRSVLLGAEHDKYRPTGLKPGETKFYDIGDGKGKANTVHLANEAGIAIDTQAGDTTITTPNGKMTVSSKGDIKYSSDKGNFFVNADGKIHLGSSDGKKTFAVVTTKGPSSKVFAAL
jgi:phage baseplate assembly protein V